MKRLLVALCALCPALSLAWIDTGHMVVADIAARDLRPAVRAKVDALLKIGGDVRTRDILGAACWADDTKTKENGVWHYIDHYFRADGILTKGKDEPQNVVWAIEHFGRILQDKSSKESDRADALRFLLHFVGDVHQPLHAVARVTDALPEGDRGGNDFKFNEFELGGFQIKSLHFLWDIGGGLLAKVTRPLDSSSVIDELATRLIQENPRSSYGELGVTDPKAWSEESMLLAESVVYGLPVQTRPGDRYLAMCQFVSGRRLALAGYRLADLLNQTLVQ